MNPSKEPWKAEDFRGCPRDAQFLMVKTNSKVACPLYANKKSKITAEYAII